MAKEESEDTPASSSAGGPSLLSQPQVAVEMQGVREGGRGWMQGDGTSGCF